MHRWSFAAQSSKYEEAAAKVNANAPKENYTKHGHYPIVTKVVPE
jgi:hypothetical protein